MILINLQLKQIDIKKFFQKQSFLSKKRIMNSY